jgi:hypothetical protein
MLFAVKANRIIQTRFGGNRKLTRMVRNVLKRETKENGRKKRKQRISRNRKSYTRHIVHLSINNQPTVIDTVMLPNATVKPL